MHCFPELRTQNRFARTAATVAFPATKPSLSAPVTVCLAQLWAEVMTRPVSRNVHSPWMCWNESGKEQGPGPGTSCLSHRPPHTSSQHHLQTGRCYSLKGFECFGHSNFLGCHAEKQTAVPQNSRPSGISCKLPRSWLGPAAAPGVDAGPLLHGAWHAHLPLSSWLRVGPLWCCLKKSRRPMLKLIFLFKETKERVKMKAIAPFLKGKQWGMPTGHQGSLTSNMLPREHLLNGWNNQTEHKPFCVALHF